MSRATLGDAVHARLGETVQQRLHADLAAVHVRKEGRCASFPTLLEPSNEGLAMRPL